jgi:hypothetical protein
MLNYWVKKAKHFTYFSENCIFVKKFKICNITFFRTQLFCCLKRKLIFLMLTKFFGKSLELRTIMVFKDQFKKMP